MQRLRGELGSVLIAIAIIASAFIVSAGVRSAAHSLRCSPVFVGTDVEGADVTDPDGISWELPPGC